MEQEINLRDFLRKYLDCNHLSIRHVAVMTGINYYTLYNWVHAGQKLNQRNTTKVKDYLDGKYIVSAHTVALNYFKDAIKENKNED